MKRIVTIIFLTLAIGHRAFAIVPIDAQRWVVSVDGGDTTFRAEFGGAVKNYKSGGQWFPIVNTLVPEGDSILKCETNMVKTRILRSNGRSQVSVDYGGDTYTATQRLYGIGWLKMSTGQHLWIDSTMSFGNLTTDSTSAKYTNVSPGVDYAIIQDLGQVRHGVYFKPAFLDSAVKLYNLRADSLDIALANVMFYTLSSNIKDSDSAIGDVDKRKIWDIGKYAFDLDQQGLRVLGRQITDSTPVRQLWKRINNVLVCVEYVPFHSVKGYHVEFPTATIWHNLSATVSDPHVEDCGISNVGTNTNAGGIVSMPIYASAGGANNQMLIRAIGLNNSMGASRTISSCSLYVRSTVYSATGTVYLYRMLKNLWIEGGCTYLSCELTPGSGVGATRNYWNNAGLKNWSTFYGECANDDGVDNSSDDSLTCNASTNRDRKSTAEGSVSITATGLYAINCTSAAQAASDSLNLILRHGGAGTGDREVGCTENTTASNRPYFVFNYTSTSGLITLGRGIDEARDTHLRQQFATTNYGTNTSNSWGGDSASGSEYKYLFAFPALASYLYGRIVDSAKLTVYVTARDAVATDVSGFMIVRRVDWEEAQATWNIFKTANNWGTAGAYNTTSDVYSTAYNTFSPSGLTLNADNVLTVTAALQAMDNTDTTSAGLLLRHTAVEGGLETIASANSATVGQRPYLRVWWHYPVVGGAKPARRRRILSHKENISAYSFSSR
jgi:hypothetical protein